METTEITQNYMNILQTIAQEYRDDAQFRAQLDASPRDVLAGKGLTMPAEGDVRVFVNTENVFHLALPPDPNALISDEALAGVSGGTTCAFSSASTAISCVSTASSREG